MSPSSRAATGDLDAGQVREAVRLGLDLLQGWLRDGRLAEARLVFVTRGAVAAGPRDVGGPGLAALWGLVRAAQAEHPGRFALVDLGEPGDAAALGGLVASGEPQAAVRGGRALVPRVVRARTGGQPLAFDPAGTVLVTGGTSGIGAQVARHLAVRYGARHLLLAGRRGPRPTAPGNWPPS
ncbi:SDR family NAD(P)-dependent oxidoreductase OS=Streptomyces alboniger OX=132473 GN=CP975_27355 PE=4 SV=1 [Streptomyces alboniger]